MNLFKQLISALEFIELKLSNCKNFCLTCSLTHSFTQSLTACLPTLIDLPPKLLGIYSLHSFPGESLFPSAQTFLVFISLSLISGKSAFLHDGYIAAIENCCVPIVVKCILFTTCVVSLLLGALFYTIFAMRIISLLLGALFNTKL